MKTLLGIMVDGKGDKARGPTPDFKALPMKEDSIKAYNLVR
jgi:hypothetical protein